MMCVSKEMRAVLIACVESIARERRKMHAMYVVIIRSYIRIYVRMYLTT